ncbi:MAG: hypothetical protein AB7P23_11070 [Amphiplicatus sp.]
MKNLLAAVAAIAALGLSLPAAAAIFTLSSALPAPAGALPAASATTGVVFQNATTSVAGLRRSPWQGTIHDGAYFTSISGGASAVYDLAGLHTDLSILWGSVDTYNDIDFYAGAALVDTLNGSALIAAGAPQGLSFIVALITANAAFDRIVIRSGTNAFEFANLATTPIPGAAFLILSGLAGLGFASGRKRASA